MLSAQNLQKSYAQRANTVKVLQGLNLSVAEGEFVSIVGMSGSGKSTLLHLLGVLDVPDSGQIMLDGFRIDNLPNRERDQLRNRTFGYVFQFYHLLPELNALDNVLMPAYIHESMWSWWGSRRKWRKRGQELLERVGLGHRMHHKPREMSGGEMQRAAVARALLMSPRILLADEPTGNLDVESGESVLQLLLNLNRNDGVTVVMVTHNTEMARRTDRIVRMQAGYILEEPAPSSFPSRKLTAVA